MVILIAVLSSIFTTILIRKTDNSAFAAKPVPMKGTISNLQVYWQTFFPSSPAKTIFNINCPTNMVAISGGAKYTWERLNTYPVGNSITPNTDESGFSIVPATGWEIELPSEPTAPLVGFVVCGEVN